MYSLYVLVSSHKLYLQVVLQREVARYEREHVQMGNAFGELDHPDYSSR